MKQDPKIDMTDKKNRPFFGCFQLVLHAHLPYVINHGRWPHGLDWLNEAAAEVYLPLIEVFNRLADEGIDTHITIDITPILAEQLCNKVFKEDFVKYLKERITSAETDRAQFIKEGFKEKEDIASMWVEFYKQRLEQFLELNRDIVGGFKKLQDRGMIEIITAAATHGYLPLLGDDKNVRIQVKTAVLNFEKHFGRRPEGIWLPECAYRPAYKWKQPIGRSKLINRKGVEEILSEEGIKYTFIDTPLLRGGESIGAYIGRFKSLKLLWERFKKDYKPRPVKEKLTPYLPYFVVSKGKENGVSFFVRDPETGLVVWSRDIGYPGNGDYLEFHKKSFPGGHRYWRVSDAKSELGLKEVYSYENAKERLKEHAAHFVTLTEDILSGFYNKEERAGIITAAFDAELFGHWWFEGPLWIYYVMKGIHSKRGVDTTSGSLYLRENPPERVINLPEGSWGKGNFHYIWLNKETEWTWKKIYECEAKFNRILDKGGVKKRAIPFLIQAAKELLLLESSDWQFLISTWQARDYAENRFSEHYESFHTLLKFVKNIQKGKSVTKKAMSYLTDLEIKDSIFHEMTLDSLSR